MSPTLRSARVGRGVAAAGGGDGAAGAAGAAASGGSGGGTAAAGGGEDGSAGAGDAAGAPPPPPPPAAAAAAAPAVDMHRVAYEVMVELKPIKKSISPNTLPQDTLITAATRLLSNLQQRTGWIPRGHNNLNQPQHYVDAVRLLGGMLHNVLSPLKKPNSSRRVLMPDDFMADVTQVQISNNLKAQKYALLLADAIESTLPGPAAAAAAAAAAGAVDMHRVASEVMVELMPIKRDIFPNTFPQATLVTAAANLLSNLQQRTGWVPRGHDDISQPRQYADAVRLLGGMLHNVLNSPRKPHPSKRRFMPEDFIVRVTQVQRSNNLKAVKYALLLADAIESTLGGPAAAAAPEAAAAAAAPAAAAAAPVAVAIPAAAAIPATPAAAARMAPVQAAVPAVAPAQAVPPAQPVLPAVLPAAAPPASPAQRRLWWITVMQNQAAAPPAANALAMLAGAAAEAPVLPVPGQGGPPGGGPADQGDEPINQDQPAPPPGNDAQADGMVANMSEDDRRLTSVRFEHYLAGRKNEFDDFNKNDNAPRILQKQLPLPGRWPGLSQDVSSQRWQDAEPNHQGFKSERRRYMRLKLDSNMYRRTDASYTAQTVRAHNEAANDPVAVPENLKPNIVSIARRVRRIWLKYRRMLHVDEHGAVVLFRNRQKWGRNHQITDIAVKEKWIADGRPDAKYYTKAKEAHKQLQDSKHIVKMIDPNNFLEQVVKVNKSHKVTTVPNTAYDELRSNPKMLFLEYMDLDSLDKYLEKLANSGVLPPAQTLWMILHCLVDQCIALRHQKDTDDIATLENSPDAPSDLLHMDISPESVFLGSVDKHENFPIAKLSNLRKYKEKPNPRQMSAADIKQYRETGSNCFMPEQFTDEWDYLPDGSTGYPGDGDPLLAQWTAGNFGTHSNIYQMGQIMESLLVLEKPLVPPVPSLHYIKPAGYIIRPEWETRPIEGDGDEQAYLARAIEFYDTELVNCGYDEVAAHTRTHSEFEDLKRINPESEMAPDVALKLFPYSYSTGRGWFWTYATMLHKHYEEDTPFEPALCDLVYLMMAHRPALRPTLERLKLSVSANMRMLDQRRGEADIAFGGRKRDDEQYSMRYAQTNFDLLYTGVRRHKHQFPNRQRIIPFSDDAEGNVLPWDNSDESD